jgi:hypothetical protein
LEVEIEVGQRFDERKVRELGLGQHPPLGAGGGFGIQQAVQEIEVGKFLFARLLGNGIDQLRHALEFQALEVRLDALIGQAHSRAS